MLEAYELSYRGGLAELGIKLKGGGLKKCEDTML